MSSGGISIGTNRYCNNLSLDLSQRGFTGMRSRTKLEDVPELLQQIQLRLQVKEAARTSVLSKSWQHAWSTIPTLRFRVRETNHLNVVDRTLKRYLRDNLPIETFDLDIDVQNQESASLAENWIQSLATKTCLKELSLSTWLSGASFTLPDEILSVAENLTRISISSSEGTNSFWMTSSHQPPIIKCASLREVHLVRVRISQEVLDGILSSCRLLEKIKLPYQKHLNTIKVQNLPCLRKLYISLPNGDSTALEISHLPNLRVFTCYLNFGLFGCPNPRPFSAYSISLGSSVTELRLGGLITDDASLDMVKSGFPFLESLTLDMRCWTLGCFRFACASVRRLSLLSCPPDRITDVQVYAPNLTFFCFAGYELPSLLFPVSSLNQTTFQLTLYMPVDASFFLKMREALMLSRECDVDITACNYKPPLDIDIDDLRTRLPCPPAINVQQLWFRTADDEGLWERSTFFDAFFEICHPKHVFAKTDARFKHNNHFSKLMLREVLEKKTTRSGKSWPSHLKRVQIRYHQNWETLRNSHRSFLDGPDIDFKLNWC